MIRCGIDRIQEFSHLFLGKRLGMVTASAAVTKELIPSYMAFHSRFPLECLFTPEHGLSGTFGNGENVREEPVEPHTGAKLVSLFGDWTAKPVPEFWLDRLDAIVYDIQDLGTRFYTFITTMMRVMEDCARADVEFIILDRPALLGGDVVEGCLLQEEYRSFIGAYPLPIRYGLTVGELARMVNEERGLRCKLQLIPCEGWHRSQMPPDFGRDWVKPSGAISDFETALLYPGMCLFEGTTLSEGRGTGQPFRLVGAPFVDGELLCREMEGLNLPGVAFSAVQFCPASSKYKGQLCQGVRIRVTDPAAFRSVRTGLYLLCKIMELWPGQVEFPPCAFAEGPHIHYLCGQDAIRTLCPSADSIWNYWKAESEEFRARKQKYHIYP
jgi:uncharacterized protein YbbC (DUF1343 family)